MFLSKAACDAAAVAEEEKDRMTVKRVLCIKPLLRAKDKAAPIPTKEASYFLSRHQINCQGQTTRSENQQKGKSTVSLLQHHDVLFDVSVHMQK